MPGINIKISKNKINLENSETRLNSFLKDNHLSSKSLFSSNELLISNWAYDGYPVKKYENRDFLIIFEGKFYSKKEEQLKDFFFKRADILWKNETNLHDFKWLDNEDAEFILIIYNKKNNQIIIQNDIQGRLPLYYSFTNGSIVVSRNIQFVKTISESVYSRTSLANYLLLGYPLGNETLYQNIKKLYPASSIKVDIGNLDLKMFENPNNFNYENKSSYDNENERIESIINTFIEACRNRCETSFKNVLSLSGGLDSRLVGGGLYNSKIKFSATTLVDPWKVDTTIGDSEVEIAANLAKRWNAGVSKINSGAATSEDLISLLNFKLGHNHLGSSYLLRYLDAVRGEFGSEITFLTGDGGDKVIKYQLASNKLKNDDNVINYIIKFHHRFYPEQISSLLDISTNDIYEQLNQVISSYPEKDHNYKFVHFVMNERVRNWLFEGEDRNRYFFWSTTPFYSYPFYKKSMSSRDNIKYQNNLYIQMLKFLDPGSESITYANTNKKINSTSSLLYYISKNYFNKLPYRVRDKIKGVVKKKTVYSEDHNFILSYIKDQVKTNSTLQNYFNLDDINKIEEINHENMKMLFTLTSIISNDDFSSISKDNLGNERKFIFN